MLDTKIAPFTLPRARAASTNRQNNGIARRLRRRRHCKQVPASYGEANYRQSKLPPQFNNKTFITSNPEAGCRLMVHLLMAFASPLLVLTAVCKFHQMKKKSDFLLSCCFCLFVTDARTARRLRRVGKYLYNRWQRPSLKPDFDISFSRR